MKWIKTDDELPPPFTDILYLCPYTHKTPYGSNELIPLSGYYDDDGDNPEPLSRRKFFASYTGGLQYEPSEVLYWTPYPKPPKGYIF